MIESLRPNQVSFDGRRGWRTVLPGGRPVATPAIAGGRVFIGGGYASHEFYSFDAVTGQLAWQIGTKDDGPTAAIVSAGLVAFNTESCTLYVVEAATGRVVWERWLGDPLMAQPAADGERVYMAYPDREHRHQLACFDLASGAPLWTTPVGHDIITAPVLHEGALYVSTYDGHVHHLDALTGRRVWAEDFRATSAPWVVGDRVLVSKRAEGEAVPVEEVHAYHRHTGERSGRRAYASEEAAYLRTKRGTLDGQRLDALDAAVGFAHAPAAAKLNSVESLVGEYRVSGSWRYQGSRPVVAGDRCFLIVGDEIRCNSVATEEVLWHRPAPADASVTRRLSPPALANGKLFFALADGTVLCLDQATGADIWSCNVGEPLEWSPAVHGGRVYVGSATGSLICLETGDPADTGWPMWGGGPGHNGYEAGRETPVTEARLVVAP
ncbi:MAG: PQQ-binding-like beta-propeller repeat protein [Candidatus Sericytochromatia bacterium]|nr:PQQ-binding-like beta-propeller repeat protein [Candidatus Tanganyikabacteria bacterium]